MKKIERNQLKNIKGGDDQEILPEGFSCCSVKCADGKIKERECGAGVMCSTSGTTVYCGSDAVNLCA